jgi:hypothetical protein
VKLGFTQEEADREIFLEAARTEPPSKFELEYLAHERAAEEVWLNGSAKVVTELQNGISVDDFHAYMPMHQYIFEPSRDIWAASSVNARPPKIETVEDGETKKVPPRRGSTATSPSNR